MKLPHVHEKYVLLEEIAQGGMAIVYRSKSIGVEGFAKDVAIKRLLPSWSSNRDFVAMLIDEARILTQLQHQNIVQVYELGVEEDVYYIAMEYVAGIDLSELLRHLQSSGTILLQKFSFYIIMEVLKGLAFAHAQVDVADKHLQIVHRDISPQNILISHQGEVKVADFGIAKGAHRSLETVGIQVKGKYGYMAPEQARGEKVDRRADIFSVGVLLFEMLTGRRLFNGPNDLAILERVRTAQLPKGWERGLDPVVRAILRNAFALSPADRYPTANSFFKDIADYVAEKNLSTHNIELSDFLKTILPDKMKKSSRDGKTPLPPSILRKLGISENKSNKRRYVMSCSLIGLFIGTALQCFASYNYTAPTYLARTLPSGLVAQPKLEKQNIILAETPITKSQTIEPTSRKAQVGTLFVDARPWGLVSIPGVVKYKETPVRVSLSRGSYSVLVSGEEKYEAISVRAKVNSGKHTVCRATFINSPRIWCD